MNEGKIVLQRLKDTLDVLKENKVVTRLDFQIRDMIEDCIEVIDKQNKVIDLILNDYMTINEIHTMMGLPHSITTADELKEVFFRKVEENEQLFRHNILQQNKLQEQKM